jgi:hypothetical protein
VRETGEWEAVTLCILSLALALTLTLLRAEPHLPIKKNWRNTEVIRQSLF